MKRFLPKLLNFLAFQLTWTLAMLSVSRGLALWGAGLMLLNVAAHLVFNTPRNRAREAALILLGSLVGVTTDAVSLSYHFLNYQGHYAPTPEFLILFYCLWANFGTTLRVTLAWTWKSLWAAALLGAIGGPLAYFAGARLGAVSLPENIIPSLVAFALEFGILTPLWVWIASRLLKETPA